MQIQECTSGGGKRACKLLRSRAIHPASSMPLHGTQSTRRCALVPVMIGELECKSSAASHSRRTSLTVKQMGRSIRNKTAFCRGHRPGCFEDKHGRLQLDFRAIASCDIWRGLGLPI